MRRSFKTLLVAAAILGAAGPAEAAQRRRPRVPHSPSRYGVMATYHYKGQVIQRYTYPGYVDQLPPPAFLYYGYPQSGFSYGVGF